MMVPLVRKLLRDIRLPLCIVLILLCGFQALWAKVTERISGQLLPMLLWLAAGRGVSATEVEETLFAGPGKILKTLLGGDNISFFRVTDMLSISYVHPLTQVMLCVWAVGRASGAITGEIDRGTMELLLAQPLARFRVVLAHLCVDLLVIPILCLGMWAGNWIGIGLVGLKEVGDPLTGAPTPINPVIFGPALWNVAALLFAMSGYTMWFSAMGRARGRVMGAAVLLTLLQFLINVIGQLWDAVAPLRPFTVFYYYQPQQIILRDRWTAAVSTFWNGGQPLFTVNVLGILISVGLVGYALALWSFCRRDVPAPL